MVYTGVVFLIANPHSSSSVCSSLVLDEMEKQSTCELEVDAVAADILNRLEIQSKTHWRTS